MAKQRRDDFPQRIITKLRDRVAHRCSNPGCRVPTSGPVQSDPEKTVNIGKAAHICAAAPNGPRYDSAMSKEQRKGVMTTRRAGGLRKAPKRGCKAKSNLQFVATVY